MEVKVCKNCKRLFNYIYGPEICGDCLKIIPKDKKEQLSQNKQNSLNPKVMEEEETYSKVKEYILSHPFAKVSQIAEANDTTAKKILDWIREERLEFSDESRNAWFECIQCGTKIRSGRLCSSCKKKP